MLVCLPVCNVKGGGFMCQLTIERTRFENHEMIINYLGEMDGMRYVRTT